MLFQSHVPSFIDAEPEINKQYFKDTQDLLNNEWIKGWNKGQPGFTYYYSPRDGRWSKGLLMAMWDDQEDKEYGKKWWVLGYSDSKLDLPKWECPQRLNEFLGEKGEGGDE